MLRELPSLAALAQAISLRAALMPEYAFASGKRRFRQLILLLAQRMTLYPFSFFRTFGITDLKKTKLQHKYDQQIHFTNGVANCHSAMTRRINYESEKYVHHQELVVEPPSSNSPERMRRRWLVLGEFAKYAFCGLKRKRRDFERSVLKYVSIKTSALTHSGRKSRVCVNQPDRLTHPAVKTSPLLLPFSLPFCFSCISAFPPLPQHPSPQGFFLPAPSGRLCP